jgi:hypothetical protein
MGASGSRHGCGAVRMLPWHSSAAEVCDQSFAHRFFMDALPLSAHLRAELCIPYRVARLGPAVCDSLRSGDDGRWFRLHAFCGIPTSRCSIRGSPQTADSSLSSRVAARLDRRSLYFGDRSPGSSSITSPLARRVFVVLALRPCLNLGARNRTFLYPLFLHATESSLGSLESAARWLPERDRGTARFVRHYRSAGKNK